MHTRPSAEHEVRVVPYVQAPPAHAPGARYDTTSLPSHTGAGGARQLTPAHGSCATHEPDWQYCPRTAQSSDPTTAYEHAPSEQVPLEAYVSATSPRQARAGGRSQMTPVHGSVVTQAPSVHAPYGTEPQS